MPQKLQCPMRHTLRSIEYAPFDEEWKCDICSTLFDGPRGRWRCIQKCDWDGCSPCVGPHIKSSTNCSKSAETALVGPGNGIRPRTPSTLPHRHPVSYVNYECNECKRLKSGARLHCPDCLYDICPGCGMMQLFRSDESDEIAAISLGDNPEPFAEGASRVAFKVTASMKDGRFQTYVLKSWKPQFLKDGEDMSEIVKIHLEARRLAEIYNKEVPTNHPITFDKPVLHSMTNNYYSSGKLIFRKGEVVALEPFIDGEYEKFNSNSGWLSGKYRAPDAFTHFTWHRTRNLIVCDLQGTRRVTGAQEDGYFLTDPAICSVSEEWGLTDIGAEGIKAFFDNHRCTDLCNDWSKPRFAQPRIPQKFRNTSFRQRPWGHRPYRAEHDGADLRAQRKREHDNYAQELERQINALRNLRAIMEED